MARGGGGGRGGRGGGAATAANNSTTKFFSQRAQRATESAISRQPSNSHVSSYITSTDKTFLGSQPVSYPEYMLLTSPAHQRRLTQQFNEQFVLPAGSMHIEKNGIVSTQKQIILCCPLADAAMNHRIGATLLGAVRDANVGLKLPTYSTKRYFQQDTYSKEIRSRVIQPTSYRTVAPKIIRDEQQQQKQTPLEKLKEEMQLGGQQQKGARADGAALFSQERIRFLSRDSQLMMIDLLTQLLSHTCGLVETTADRAPYYSMAKRIMEKAQEQFENGASPFEYSGSAAAFAGEEVRAPFTFVIEAVYDSEGEETVKHRLWACIRDPEVLEFLRNRGQRSCEDQIAQRYQEDYSYAHNSGHNPDFLTAEEIEIRDKIHDYYKKAAEAAQNAADVTQGADPGLENGHAHVPMAIDSSDSAEQQRERQQMETEFRALGFNYSNTPPSRLSGPSGYSRAGAQGCLLRRPETGLMKSITPWTATNGVSRETVARQFSFLWSGDAYVYDDADYARRILDAKQREEYVHKTTAFDVGNAQQRLSDIAEVRSLRCSGYYQHDNPRDFPLLGETYDETRGALFGFDPAHVFAPHVALNAWCPGDGDTRQQFIGNYFRMAHESDADFGLKVVYGESRSNLHSLYNREVRKSKNAELQRAMGLSEHSHGVVNGLLLSGVDKRDLSDPCTIGSLFRGFPFPERCVLLSPMLCREGNIMISPLPPVHEPAPTDLKASAKPVKYNYSYNAMVAASRFLLPQKNNSNNDDAKQKQQLLNDFEVVHSSPGQYMLHGTPQQIAFMVQDETARSVIKPHLRAFIGARCFIRWMGTMASGQLNDWLKKLNVTWTGIREIGDATLKRNSQITESMMDAVQKYNFFSQDDSAEADTMNAGEWKKFMDQTKYILCVRFEHLRNSFDAELEMQCVSPFVRRVKSLAEILPSKTQQRFAPSPDERQTVNGILWNLVYNVGDVNAGIVGVEQDTNSAFNAELLMAHKGDSVQNQVLLGTIGVNTSDGITPVTLARAKRNTSGRPLPPTFTGTTYNGTEVLMHRSWKQNGKLGEAAMQAKDTFDFLRCWGHWTDFVNAHNEQYKIFVDSMVAPLELYVLKHANDASAWAIVTPVVTAINDVQQFSALMMRDNLRPMFFPANSWNKKELRNSNDVAFPDAFHAVLSMWETELANTTAVESIPYDTSINRWSNISSSYGTMRAWYFERFMELGALIPGMSHMAEAAAALDMSINSSTILERERDRVPNLNIIIPGKTGIGKSWLAKFIYKFKVKGTWADVGSFTDHSFDIYKVWDGLCMLLEEGINGTQVDAKNQNNYVVDMLKRILASGINSRFAFNRDESGNRDSEKIVSSHRRSVIILTNRETHLMDPALLSRFFNMPIPNSVSSRGQPLDQTQAAIAGMNAALDRYYARASFQEAVRFPQLQHATKIVIDELANTLDLSTQLETQTNYAHRILGPMKNKMKYESVLMRLHQNIPLCLDTEVRNHAGWCLTHDWKEYFHYNGRGTSHTCIPIEFILTRAPKYLFATKGMIAHVLSILFRDQADNFAHVEVAKGLHKNIGVQGDLARARSVVEELDRVLVGVPIVNDMGWPNDVLPANPKFCRWTDDPKLSQIVDQSASGVMCYDPNYVVYKTKAQSFKSLCEQIRVAIGDRYAQAQLTDAVIAMLVRTWVPSPETDYSYKLLKDYDKMMANPFEKQVEKEEQRKLEKQKEDAVAQKSDTQRKEAQEQGKAYPPSMPVAAFEPPADGQLMYEDLYGVAAPPPQQQRSESEKLRAKVRGALGTGPQQQQSQHQQQTTETPLQQQQQQLSVADNYIRNMQHDLQTREWVQAGQSNTMTMQEAAQLGLPLRKYNHIDGIPLAKVVTIRHGPKTQHYCFAIARWYVEQAALFDKDKLKSEDDLPTQMSTLLTTIEGEMTSTAPRRTVPPVVRLPLHVTAQKRDPARPYTETLLASYPLNTMSSYVRVRTEAAVQAALKIFNDDTGARGPGQTHPKLMRFINQLPKQLESEGCSLSAPTPLTITHPHQAEARRIALKLAEQPTVSKDISMTVFAEESRQQSSSSSSSLLFFNEGATSYTTSAPKKALNRLLKNSTVLSIADRAFLTNARNFPETLQKPTEIDQSMAPIARLVAVLVERCRIKYRVGQNMREIHYGTDWDSLVRHSVMQMVPEDPTTPEWYSALDEVNFPGHSIRYAARLDRELTQQKFPHGNLIHQIKNRIVSAASRMFSNMQKHIVDMQPDMNTDESGGTLPEWILMMMTKLDEKLRERDQKAERKRQEALNPTASAQQQQQQQKEEEAEMYAEDEREIEGWITAKRRKRISDDAAAGVNNDFHPVPAPKIRVTVADGYDYDEDEIYDDDDRGVTFMDTS